MVTLPAVLALRLLCVVRGLTVDALAAPLQRVEFEGASQPLLPGERIGAIWGKPDGPGPFSRCHWSAMAAMVASR